MKKLWKDFERLSAECYINMGKGKTDMMQWHQAFDALMGAIEETRSRNPDFAGEFYEVDEQTDFEYGVDDWLLDYLDELGMRNLHEKCCEVCEKVIGLFAWKEQLPEDFVFPSEAEAFRGPRQTLYLNTQASRLPLRLGLAFSPPDRRALLDRSFAAVLAVLAVSALFLFGFYYILRAVAARLRAYALDMEHIAASGFNGRLKASRLYELEEIGLRFNDTLGRSFSYVIRARILYHHCLLQQPH